MTLHKAGPRASCPHPKCAVGDDMVGRIYQLETALRDVLDIYDIVPGNATHGWYWSKVRDIAKAALKREVQQ